MFKKRITFLNTIAIMAFASCSGPTNSQVNDNGNDIEDSALPIINKSNQEDLQIAEYVVEVFEDSQHYLWLGTMSKGVARFDPNANLKPNPSPLTYFDKTDGLSGPTIASVAEDKYGNLWFGGHNGLSRWNFTENQGDEMEFIDLWKSEGNHDDGMGWVGVSSDRNGNIWATSRLGIFTYEFVSPTEGEFVKFELPIDKSKIETYSITAGRPSIELIDSKGNMWFSADGYGLLKYDGSNFTRFTKEDGLCSNTVNSVVEDKEGNLWIVCMQSYQPAMTHDGGLCCMHLKENGEYMFVEFSDTQNLSGIDLYSLYCDSKGDIWIGATGLGIYRFSHESYETFKLYEGTNRMDITDRMGIQSILEDHNGNMWFGFSGGLFRLKDSEIVNVTKLGPWN